MWHLRDCREIHKLFLFWMDPKKCLWGPVLVAECEEVWGRAVI